MLIAHIHQLHAKLEREGAPTPPPCDPNSEVVQAALKEVLDQVDRLEQLFTKPEPPKKARKPRGPMSEEAKAKMLAARRATIAAKAAGATPLNPKAYTLGELKAFSALIIDGEYYGVNKRGDVVSEDGGFMGHYDQATKTLDRSAPEPADWLEVAGEP
jgi:hypothetical protein